MKHLAYGIHIHLNLLARKKVFNFNLVKLLMSQFTLAVPLFYSSWHHHDLNVGSNEGIDEGGTCNEMVGLEWRYKEDCHLIALHGGNDLIFIKVHLFAQEPCTIERAVSGDKSTKAVALKVLVLETLGESYSSLHTSVDEHLLDVGITTVGIVQTFDKHSQTPHEHSGHNEKHDDTIEAWDKQIRCEFCIHLYLMKQTGANACKSSTVGYAMEVNEARVAHHTVVSVESKEGDDIHYETQAETKGDLPEVLCQLQTSMLEVIHKES